ncbi:hypothetical protein SGM_1082 [Streptomyces griseoaurantiacus M045]|uniref:Uncharacterized protein n=1 Tax=Streptomyces griseoaurantiacus M045 TaxID=996637 RepID=F3ND68_9ACTN|nr:hypothetical protein SGM_1082 [Streptomyces griseoaurantiacus M045]
MEKSFGWTGRFLGGRSAPGYPAARRCHVCRAGGAVLTRRR